MKIEDVNTLHDLKMKVAELEAGFLETVYTMRTTMLELGSHSKLVNRTYEINKYIEEEEEKKKDVVICTGYNCNCQEDFKENINGDEQLKKIKLFHKYLLEKADCSNSPGSPFYYAALEEFIKIFLSREIGRLEWEGGFHGKSQQTNDHS